MLLKTPSADVFPFNTSFPLTQAGMISTTSVRRSKFVLITKSRATASWFSQEDVAEKAGDAQRELPINTLKIMVPNLLLKFICGTEKSYTKCRKV